MAKNYGLDVIGGTNYIREIKRTHVEGRCIGVLVSADGWDESGAWQVIKQAAKFGGCPIIKCIGRWHDSHNFNDNDIPRSISQLNSLNQIAEEYPDQEFWFNPWLEYRTKTEHIERLFQALINRLAPNVKLVLNPETTDQPFRRRKVIIELHHKHWKKLRGYKQSFSFDGIDQVDADLLKYLDETGKCKCFWGWDWRLNGKYGNKDTAKRPDRDNYADEKMLKSLWAQFTDNKGPFRLKQPAGNKRLYKSHADNHGDGNSRSEKPLFLIPDKASKVELVVNRKVVYTFPFEKQFAHDYSLYVYRAPNWGFEIADILKKHKKRPIAKVRVGGKIIGRVNVVLRTGYFRNQ